MKTNLTNKQLQDTLRKYPDNMIIDFVTDAQKIFAWHGTDKPDWAIRIEQTSNDKLSIYIAEYNKVDV
jgi:hypothetical protein